MALEADLGWMQIAGADPDEFLIRYPDRIPVVHLKDFYASDPKAIHYTPDLEEHRGGAEHAHFEFRPLGYGLSDLPVLVPKALALNPDWVVVDHDLSYERNPYYDLQMSLDYLLNLLDVYKRQLYTRTASIINDSFGFPTILPELARTPRLESSEHWD